MSDHKPASSPLFAVIETAVVASIYVGLVWLGQLTAIPSGIVTRVFAPSGFALAVVLYRGYRAWPGLWLGSLVGYSWTFLDAGSPIGITRTVAVGAAIGFGDVLQAWIGAYVLREFCGGDHPCRRLRNVFVFLSTQSVVCLLGGTFGMLCLCLGRTVPWENCLHTWLTWYLAQYIGVILMAPVLLTWTSFVPILRAPLRMAEFLALLVSNVLAASAVFIGPSPFVTRHDPLAILSLPLILWAAIRFEQFGVSFTILVVSGLAVSGTAHGHGPFVADEPWLSLMLLQLFMAISVVTGLSLATSLTERKDSAERLRRTELQLEQALTAGNVGLWDWDVETNKAFFSPQAKAQLGYDPDESWGAYDDWESRLHPEDCATAIQNVRDYLNSRADEYVSTFRLRHKDGSYRWILSRGKGEWNDEGRPVRVFGVHVDISERKHQSEELERSNMELQQFAFAASHDLQEPLRSITSFTQLLERKHRDQFDEESQAWLTAVISGAGRMKSLIEDLLCYTRLDSRSLPFQPTDLRKVIDDVRANLDSSIKDSGAQITHDEDLPIVLADPTQLIQLFQNLVANAIKFHGEDRPQVHIAARRLSNEWLFSVRDNGIGIDPKYHDRIFEVFRRLHHRREHPGNGMGLAISRRVVHRHGGRIWLESEQGQGSTFFFSLPIEPSEEA